MTRADTRDRVWSHLVERRGFALQRIGAPPSTELTRVVGEVLDMLDISIARSTVLGILLWFCAELGRVVGAESMILVDAVACIVDLLNGHQAEGWNDSVLVDEPEVAELDRVSDLIAKLDDVGVGLDTSRSGVLGRAGIGKGRQGQQQCRNGTC